MANEKRLVDAYAIEKHCRNTKIIELFPEWKDFPYAMKIALIQFGKEWKKIIQNAPTVEAVEVVHGRWLNWMGEPISPDDYWRLHRCSVCGNEWEFPEAVDTDEVGFNYCPNCGADMRGSEE